MQLFSNLVRRIEARLPAWLPGWRGRCGRLWRRLAGARLWLVLPGGLAGRGERVVLPFSLGELLRERARDLGLPLASLLTGILSAALREGHSLEKIELVWRQLTEREREIACLMARGLSNQAIADRLMISRNTVRTHAQQVLNKFGCRRRVELPIELCDRLTNLA